MLLTCSSLVIGIVLWSLHSVFLKISLILIMKIDISVWKKKNGLHFNISYYLWIYNLLKTCAFALNWKNVVHGKKY